MSVAKPFVFALACVERGAQDVRDRVGVNATGHPFDSLAPLDQSEDGRSNPMVNPGAIATTSLVPGSTPRDPMGTDPSMDCPVSRVARSPSMTRSIDPPPSRTCATEGSLDLLRSLDRLDGDPQVALDLYTRQSCLGVTATRPGR